MSLSFPSRVWLIEQLERRALLAAVFPTADEQLLVELINRGRADPAAEAARYGIALNEGVPSGDFIFETPKQPLAINPNLTDAARDHSAWMIENDVFSHTGANGSSPQSRMTASGYVFTGSWASGENLAYRGSTGAINVTALTAQLHADLFIDTNYPGRGHRVNQMNPTFREIGAGVASGIFTSGGNSYNAVMGTEDFARTGTAVFLTGVAYSDAVTNDDFYTVGEALAGVTVTATRTSDNAVFSTTTWGSGGYALALPAGTYTVTGASGPLGGTVVHGGVVIGTENVKRDFRPDLVAANFASLSAGGALTVTGTASADSVALSLSGGTLTATRNGFSQMFTAANVASIAMDLGAGNDVLTVGTGVIAVYAIGGEGDDVLVGGTRNDTLTGGAGKDRIYGGVGDDRLSGSGGHDRLWGEGGKDRLYGGLGNDQVDGGAHTDRLWGDGGLDNYFGQSGNDYMYALDGENDYLAGGSGTDTAQHDPGDVLGSVELIV